MFAPPIRVTQPRLLQETVQTLRKLGLSLPSSATPSPLTITPYPSSPSSHFPGKVG